MSSQDRDQTTGATAAEVSGSTSREEYSHRPTAADGEARQRERFGGINWGAGFFGWLVAIGIAALLMSILGAIGAAIGSTTSVTQSEAERQAGTIGVVAGVALVVVLLIAYFTGGYVAGRMSRFDGGKQGLAVWLIGLLVTVIAFALGWIFGDQYNILNRVNLPNIPLSQDALTTGAAATAAAVVLGTLLAAMLGGKVGHRYHDKVDREAYR